MENKDQFEKRWMEESAKAMEDDDLDDEEGQNAQKGNEKTSK